MRLGLTLTEKMSWNLHVNNILTSASKKMGQLKRLQFRVSQDTLLTLYKTQVRSSSEYADVIWDACPHYLSDKLESVQYTAARICTGAMRGTRTDFLLNELGLPSSKSRRSKHQLILFYKILYDNFAPYLRSHLPKLADRTGYHLRSEEPLCFLLRGTMTKRFSDSFIHSASRAWNSLPLEIRSAPTVSAFKRL